MLVRIQPEAQNLSVYRSTVLNYVVFCMATRNGQKKQHDNGRSLFSGGSFGCSKVGNNYVAQTKEQLPKFMQSIASSIEDRYIDAHIPEEWGW